MCRCEQDKQGHFLSLMGKTVLINLTNIEWLTYRTGSWDLMQQDLILSLGGAMVSLREGYLQEGMFEPTSKE